MLRSIAPPLRTSSVIVFPPTVTRTRAPIALRFDRVPSNRNPNPFPRFPSTRYTTGPAPRFVTTISSIPSPSKSPTASPRDAIGVPIRAVANTPPPFQYSDFVCRCAAPSSG